MVGLYFDTDKTVLALSRAHQFDAVRALAAWWSFSGLRDYYVKKHGAAVTAPRHRRENSPRAVSGESQSCLEQPSTHSRCSDRSSVSFKGSFRFFSSPLISSPLISAALAELEDSLSCARKRAWVRRPPR